MNCIEFVDHRFAVIRHQEVAEFFPDFPQYQEENPLAPLEIDPPWIAHRYESYIADLIVKTKRKLARRDRGRRYESAKQSKFQSMVNSEKGLHTPIIELKFCQPIAGCFWYLKGKKNWLLRFRSTQDQITNALKAKGFQLVEGVWRRRVGKMEKSVEFFTHQWDRRMVWVAVGISGKRT